MLCFDGPPTRLIALIALAGAGAFVRPARAQDEPVIPPDTAGAVSQAYGSALPAFALFGWASPPRDSTTPARYGELAATGFNVTLVALDEQGTWADNRVRLDCSRPFGLKGMLLDNDLDSVFVDRPETLAWADTIVGRYKDDPAFLGYYLGDEPYPDFFPRLAEWFQVLRERDPAHPAWNSLRPRGGFTNRARFQEYLEEYVAATRPAVLCNNQYDFLTTGDSGLLVENVAALGAVARAHGIPFWGVLQLVEHWIFRPVTEGMLRWQAAQWLAGGARGLGYFTYWTPPPLPGYGWGDAMIDWETGARTEYYDMVTALNAKAAPVGRTLAALRFVATRFAGHLPRGGDAFTPDSVLAAVEGRAILGWFADARGLSYLLLANADSAEARTLTLASTDGRAPYRLRDDGSAWVRVPVFDGGRFLVTLAPGDFTLLRFPVRVRTADAGAGPGPVPALRVTPNPSFGAVRFDLAAVPEGSVLEVLDLAGRVVWSRALARGATTARWSGERTGGGHVAGGAYFVRLRTPAGTAVRRLAWLGAR